MTSGFVYFAASKGLKAIKIGYSRSPDIRVEDLRRQAGSDLTLIGVMPGTQAIELDTHKNFSDYRIQGRNEWFSDCEPIRQFAREHLTPLTAEMLSGVGVGYRAKIVFFRVTKREYKAAAAAAKSHGMRTSVWLRRVVQQKLGIEETV